MKININMHHGRISIHNDKDYPNVYNNGDAYYHSMVADKGRRMFLKYLKIYSSVADKDNVNTFKEKGF